MPFGFMGDREKESKTTRGEVWFLCTGGKRARLHEERCGSSAQGEREQDYTRRGVVPLHRGKESKTTRGEVWFLCTGRKRARLHEERCGSSAQAAETNFSAYTHKQTNRIHLRKCTD